MSRPTVRTTVLPRDIQDALRKFRKEYALDAVGLYGIITLTLPKDYEAISFTTFTRAIHGLSIRPEYVGVLHYAVRAIPVEMRRRGIKTHMERRIGFLEKATADFLGDDDLRAKNGLPRRYERIIKRFHKELASLCATARIK